MLRQGGTVRCLARSHGFSMLLERWSSVAAQVAESTERIEKEQPAGVPTQNLQDGARAADTATSAVDKSTVVAAYAGIVALLGSTYLGVSSSRKKPKSAPPHQE